MILDYRRCVIYRNSFLLIFLAEELSYCNIFGIPLLFQIEEGYKEDIYEEKENNTIQIEDIIG